MPPRRFAGFGANAPLSASQRATVNPYGITLDRTWTEWAAEQGLSETVAAALYLISENRKTDEVVVNLRPSEIARVIDIVQCWPDCFPPGALGALTDNRTAFRAKRARGPRLAAGDVRHDAPLIASWLPIAGGLAARRLDFFGAADQINRGQKGLSNPQVPGWLQNGKVQ
jgi:hypothetical protein